MWKVKLLDGWDLKAMLRKASKCWLSILVALIEQYKASNKQSQLVLSKANQSKTDGAKESNEEWAAQMKAVRAAKQT